MSEPIWQNYHKHTSLSNVYIKDSSLTHIDYWKELKSRYEDKLCIYSTVEHGWAGNYFKTYSKLEDFNKKNETNIQFTFGYEAYWVKKRHENDNSNCHMILLARNDNGRKALNKILSIANKDGYYYRPRLDLELIMSLPENDVMITSACIAYWNKYEDIDEITKKLYDKFLHFYLEVQPHNTTQQKELNQHILELSKKYNIPFIAGCDSHIIDNSQMLERDDLLKSSHINHEDEVGWYLDFPTYETLVYRFQDQGILSNDQIKQAIENTNIILDFEPIVLDRSLKVPIIKPLRGKTKEERNQIFKNILKQEWENQKWDINQTKKDEYLKEIKSAIKEIEGCNMEDYFIASYNIMKDGQEKYGGILTPTGRGSAVGMYINKLLRLTKVDKINSPVEMFPERFLTKERVLESHTPPDIDNNVSERQPFIDAQKELIGDLGTYDLLALGTLRPKAAWKMYARANDVDPQVANQISYQIGNYEKTLKYAEGSQDVSIENYISNEYLPLVEYSKKYLGVYDSRKGHPCATIAYDGDVESDIGVILCKSETTNNEVLVAVIESDDIDAFGYLKQDYLIVDSIGLTYDIYKEVGLEPFTVNQLLDKIREDNATWDIYKNGLTQCVNQCEQQKSTQKVMRYQPRNISELTQFIAAIRPGFQSMYHLFESRKHFEYGIKTLDNLIQDEYRTSSFIIYQEDLMKVLEFAGFPMSDTYTVVKAISKKKESVIKEAKPRFIDGFAKAIINTGETDDSNKANKLAEKVWHIIEDNSSYGFNCVSGDTIIKGQQKTVSELYNIIHNQDQPLYSYSMTDEYKIKKNKIVDIYKQPNAMVYLVKTISGETIKCTGNHKFPTSNGIKSALELSLWDMLFLERNGEICQSFVSIVEPIGRETVYDIEMSGDVAHNFVLSNGLVTCNSAHAYCMAIDSVTIAYLKAHYPLEFYKCVLQRFTNKGDKHKVSLIKQEAIKRGISIKEVKFGDDNRQFNIDKTTNTIIQSMTGIKNMPSSTPAALYELGQSGIKTRAQLYQALIDDTRINSKAIDILFKLDYFSNFSYPNKLLYEFEIYKKFIDVKVLSKKSLTEDQIELLRNMGVRETKTQFRDFNNIELVKAMIKLTKIPQTTIFAKIKWQIEFLGYSVLSDSSIDPSYWIVVDIESGPYDRKDVTLYNICYGVTRQYRLNKKFNIKHEMKPLSLIQAVTHEKPKMKKNQDGTFSVIPNEFIKEVKCWKEFEIK